MSKKVSILDSEVVEHMKIISKVKLEHIISNQNCICFLYHLSIAAKQVHKRDEYMDDIKVHWF